MVAKTLYSPRHRAERLIASARVVLAGVSLVAIWLDPSTPSKHEAAAYGLLAVYVTYAALLLPVTWRRTAAPDALGLATHIVDLVVFSAIMYLTEGPTSPFFVYFIFSLLCAALRWGGRGISWTAMVALASYLGMGVYAGVVLRDASFELDHYLIRSTYLLVVAALLACLIGHEKRLREDLSSLVAWPHHLVEDAFVNGLLRSAAAALKARRVFMVWSDRHDGGRYLATCFNGEFSCSRLDGSHFESPFPELLAGTHFLCPDCRSRVPQVLYVSAEGLQQWRGNPIDAGLQARFDIGSILALRLRGESFSGHLAALDMRAMTSDLLLFGRVVSQQVTSDMERFYMQQQLQKSAAIKERILIARDLHDGLLQSLTAASLKLQAILHLLARNELSAATKIVSEVQALLGTEQQDLRYVIEKLKPRANGTADPGSGLTEWFAELASRIERSWDITVELDLEVNPVDTVVPPGLGYEIYRIVQEGLVNAARHAAASTVSVRIAAASDVVHITIADDGNGFPLHGRFDLSGLHEVDRGPRSLRERVSSLAGTLTLDTGPAGSILDIRLPLRREYTRRPGFDAVSPGPDLPQKALRPRAFEPADMTTRLVLADDHPLVLEGLMQLLSLEEDFAVVATAVTAASALQETRNHHPDVLVLDLRFPDGHGFDVIRAISEETLPTKVVVLTADLSAREMLDVVRLGVRGIVLKGMPPELVAQCVRTVRAGGEWLEKHVMAKALGTLLRRDASRKQLVEVLTSREIEVVDLVAQGLRNKDVARKLSISEGTVKVHVHNIYEKLKVKGRAALISYAHENDLL